MEKHILEKLISENKSTYQMVEELNISQTTVRYWLKKFGLKTHAKWAIDRSEIKDEIKSGFKTCSKCKIKKSLNENNFYMKKNGKFHYWCKNCNNKISLEKQTKRKLDCLNYRGGKCVVCGYDKYIGSLDFHHLNPTEKEFNISQLRTYSFERLKKELDKCIIVCKNCHGEIHGGIISL